MKVTILTIFPEFFDSPLNQSLLGKAIVSKKLDVSLVDIRDYSVDKHNSVDDTPFGGKSGMVMKVESLDAALHDILKNSEYKNYKIVLTSAAGKKYNHSTAISYSLLDHLIIICGRYKGVDERIKELYDIDEISIGDYVLNGGETAALAILESTFRLLPGGIGKIDSALSDSFADDLLGPALYTRPAEYRGLKVPEVLLEGNHQRQTTFRRWSSLERTIDNRPDILKNSELDNNDRKMMEAIASGKKFEDLF